jgi:hypothetical protein
VTNQTTAAITVFHQWCQPPIIIIVKDPSGNGVWYATGSDINACSFAGNRDLPPAIAASQSHIWSYAADLGPPRTVTESGIYAVVVRLNWHQGTLQQLDANPSLLQGEADGEGSVTIPQ